jgi:hypothetical protein
MIEKVPSMDMGSAMLGIMVADALRRKMKITMMTRQSVTIMVLLIS